MKKLSPLREFNYGTAREEVAVEKKRYSTPEFGTHVLPSGRFRLGSARLSRGRHGVACET